MVQHETASHATCGEAWVQGLHRDGICNRELVCEKVGLWSRQPDQGLMMHNRAMGIANGGSTLMQRAWPSAHAWQAATADAEAQQFRPGRTLGTTSAG